jgi:uncharacterized protein YceH (UPF0502 family)
MEPDAVEIRVVGCLIEKQRTTPDAYPLSLNSLRLACNQSTNRDPVVDYDEATVSEALRRLALRGWTRLASGAHSRARKYRQLMPEALGVDEGELALLGVLMLRGAQTPGELKQRSERLHGFADLGAVQTALDGLVERGYVARHERRPGQKELRYQQLLGGLEEGSDAPAPEAAADAEESEATAAPESSAAAAEGGSGSEGDATAVAGSDAAPVADISAPDPGLVPAEDRLTRLERELGELRAELARLREALGEG